MDGMLLDLASPVAVSGDILLILGLVLAAVAITAVGFLLYNRRK